MKTFFAVTAVLVLCGCCSPSEPKRSDAPAKVPPKTEATKFGSTAEEMRLREPGSAFPPGTTRPVTVQMFQQSRMRLSTLYMTRAAYRSLYGGDLARREMLEDYARAGWLLWTSPEHVDEGEQRRHVDVTIDVITAEIKRLEGFEK